MHSKSMPRRRIHVRRPSVSPAKIESKHFLKVILPSRIHGNQLRIPEEFIRRFGNELSSVATITVPDSCVWKMGLKKCGKDVWFCNGWREFAKYYSISYGSYLVFKYEGNSNFHVLIFDVTAAEICYPCKSRGTNGEPNYLDDNNTPSKCARKRSRVDNQHYGYETRSKKHRQENKVEIIDVDNVNLQSQGETRKKERYACHGKQDKSRCNQNHTSRMSKAAEKFEPKNPSFTATIKPCHVYVPAEFAANHLKLKVPMKLQNSNGQQWEVYCLTHNGSSAAMRIGKGWRAFARDNHLSVGDVCVFELIKRKHVVLKVTMFRLVEYGNSRRH